MMLDLSLLPDGGVSWLDASGPDSDIVLSARVRLARNLQARPFTVRAKPDDLFGVREQILDATSGIAVFPDAAAFSIDEMGRIERQLLHERHLISRELAGGTFVPAARGPCLFCWALCPR